jgi:hypothetical protein
MNHLRHPDYGGKVENQTALVPDSYRKLICFLRSKSIHSRFPAGTRFPVVRTVALLLAAAVFMLAAGCKPPGGITLVVNHNGDEQDSDPGDGFCRAGSSLTSCTLRAALEETNAHWGADTIHFNLPAGNTSISVTYPLPWIDGNLILDGTTQPGFVDEPLIHLQWAPTRPVTGHENGLGIGGPDWVIAIRGMEIRGFTGLGISNRSTLTLDRMRFSENGDSAVQCVTESQNYLVINDSILSGNWRGLTVQDCPAQLNRSILENSRDAGILQIRGELTVSESVIRNNAGGIQTGGSDNGERTSLSILDSIIEDNHSPESGGGIRISSPPVADLVIRDSVISGNEAEGSGGGVYIDGGTLDLSGSTLAGNSAADRGGGLFAQNLTAVSIAASTFSGNSALNQGGGMFGDGLAAATIAASTINGNFAGVSGGGLFLSGLPADSLKVSNSTVSGNNAGTNGGGIWGDGGVLELSYVTVTGNSATIAGGIVNNAAVEVRNSIVADNIGHNCFSQDPPSSLGHNLDDDSSCLFAGSGDMSGDPALLGPLQNNGGPTLTHALLPGSPAVNAADDSNCPHTDQRGVSRPQSAHCDMGAFEAEYSETPLPEKQTRTPTARPKPTATPTATAIGFLFDPVEYSANPILPPGPSCAPNMVTIRVKVSPAEQVNSVGLFHRLETKADGALAGWSEGSAMTPEGGGWYSLTLLAEDIEGIRDLRDEGFLAIQFVANGPGGEVLARSVVFRDLVVKPCTRAG